MPPYDNSADSGAADQLEADSENQQPTDDNNFYLPGDFPGAENLKAGDTITLKVVGKDKDGDIEVQHMPDEEGDQAQQKPGMMDSFDKEVG